MKTLIVFYSRTGTTKKVVERLAKELGADQEELIDQDKRGGALGYLKSGREAMQKKLATILPPQKDPSTYDLVIIGTPVWAHAMSCAIRTYLTEQKGKLSKIALFATQGGSGGETALRQIEELACLVARAKLIVTTKEAVKGDYEDKLNAFIKQLV